MLHYQAHLVIPLQLVGWIAPSRGNAIRLTRTDNAFQNAPMVRLLGHGSEYGHLNDPFSMHRWILIVGWSLLGIVLASIFFISVVSVMSSGSGLAVDYRISGWQASFIPIAYVVAYLAAIVVTAMIVVRRYRERRGNKGRTMPDKPGQPPNSP